jgi:hypothetical protein
MDISEELKQIATNDKSADDIVTDINQQYEDLVKQQHELVKRQHIFRVMSLARRMEEAVEQGFFNIKNLHLLEVECHETEHGYDTAFWLIDKDGEFISSKIPEQNKFILYSFDKITNFNGDFAQEDFMCGSHKIEIKPGIGEKLMNLFLSEELMKILEYNKMQLDLPNNNDSNTKRPKI